MIKSHDSVGGLDEHEGEKFIELSRCIAINRRPVMLVDKWEGFAKLGPVTRSGLNWTAHHRAGSVDMRD